VLSHEEDQVKDDWPAKYCMIEPMVIDDEAQQWMWDEKTGAIKNIASGHYLDYDYGWALVADLQNNHANSYFPKTPRKWFYDSVSMELRTDVEGVQSSLVPLGNLRNWGKV
jgi:hypothetical protein